jgi:hypothetical protein
MQYDDLKWLPDMDSNHDKQIQRLLCYRYTIRQWPEQRKIAKERLESSKQNGFQCPKNFDSY